MTLSMRFEYAFANVKGHQLIAKVLFDWLVENEIAHRSNASAASLNEAFERQIDSLDFGYFQRGQDRLKSVLLWSRGKAIQPGNRLNQDKQPED